MLMFRRQTEAGMTGGTASRYSSSRRFRTAYSGLIREEPMIRASEAKRKGSTFGRLSHYQIL